MKHKKSMLTTNAIVLGIALMLLVSIVAVLVWVFVSNAGMFFGMILAAFFPVLSVLVIAGAVGYAVLFVSNIRTTIRRKRSDSSSGQLRSTWLVFGGVTIIVVLIAIICGVVSTPLRIILVESWQTGNPFLTAPVRSVPTYPSTIQDNQAQYDEILESLFRSYNVPSTHPDQVADWYQDVLAEPPWLVVQVNRYEEVDANIGRIVQYCVQAARDEENGQRRIYFLEIFGRDEISHWGTHVNIGTPNPITNVCKRFLEEP